MLDIGWTELLVIGVVALIVVGPKDLPMMFRALGRFTGRMRGMARDFQRAMDDAARETGVRDMANDIRKAASPMSSGIDRLNAAADRFEKWDPLKGGPAPKPPGASSGGSSAGATTTTPATPSSPKMGPATAALAEERQTEAQAIMAANAERAAARKAAAQTPAAGAPDTSPAATPGTATPGTAPAVAPPAQDPAP